MSSVQGAVFQCTGANVQSPKCNVQNVQNVHCPKAGKRKKTDVMAWEWNRKQKCDWVRENDRRKRTNTGKSWQVAVCSKRKEKNTLCGAGKQKIKLKEVTLIL